MIKFRDYYIQIEMFSALLAAALVGYETNSWLWLVATFAALFTMAPPRPL